MAPREQPARSTGQEGPATESESESASESKSAPGPGSSPDSDVFADARDAEVRDRDGRRLGTLEQVFVSADDDRPLWVEVAGGLFGMAKNIVPAAGARRSGDALVLDVTADLVAHAPALDPSDGITAAEHAFLEAHYGLRDRVEDTTA